MTKTCKVIGICGYGNTGSSAVCDILKEFDDIQVFSDFEIDLLYAPDGIMDLDSHINGKYSYLNVDIAITRFIDFCDKHIVYNKITKGKFKEVASRYINSIIPIVWRGHSVFDMARLPNPFILLEWKIIYKFQNVVAKIGINISKLLDRNMYYAYENESFYLKTEEFLMNVIDLLGRKREIVAIDQLFPANEPIAAMKYFSNCSAIIVDRDPRDVYISTREKVRFRFMPVDNVKMFVKYYRALRLSRERWIVDDSVLFLQYEDIILNYSACVGKIKSFLEINEHSNPKSIYDPQKFVNRIRLWEKKKLNQNELEDIKYIENELSEYLYEQ